MKETTMQVPRRTLLLGSLATLALTGCSTPKQAEQLKGTATHQQLPLTTPHLSRMAAVSFELMWNLMLLGDHTGNTIASPSSLASALAMLGLGATNESAASFDRIFGMGAQERAAATNALRSAMSGYDTLPEKVDAQNPPKTPILHQATHLLLIDDIAVNPTFLDDVSRYFDTPVERVAFANAEANLNSWVSRHTAGLIEKSAIVLSKETRLVLQDALVFAAAWQTQFEEEVPIEFHHLDGTTTPAEGITHTFHCSHAELNGWQAIRLPYTEAFSMDVLLPPAGTSPYQAEVTHMAQLTQALNNSDHHPVRVTMPILDIKTTVNLLELLGQHGMDLNDFDGIFANAIVEDAKQQVRLQITAQGTVGAAVTEIAVAERATPADDLLSFVVDRPYLIDITAEATGWSLFLGAITDPTVKA